MHNQIMNSVASRCASGVTTNPLSPSLIFVRFFAEAATAVASKHDAPRPGHIQKSGPEHASNTSSDTSEQCSAEVGTKQHKPVLLSEAIKALDFDWENEDFEEFMSSADRADSSKSASTSETGGRSGGSRKKNTFRAPSKG